MTRNCNARCESSTPNSIDFMERIDRMPRQWRDLVNEFGVNVVFGMIEDGHRSAAKLRPELEIWRERQQKQWLAEIPYPRR
jgi:hypothetical protein